MEMGSLRFVSAGDVTTEEVIFRAGSTVDVPTAVSLALGEVAFVVQVGVRLVLQEQRTAVLGCPSQW